MLELDVEQNLKLNRHNGETLTKQLLRQLADSICRCPAGTRLPPERKLAAELNISRVTVRRVLNYLFEQGKIVRKGARGTFIAKSENFSFDNFHPIQMEHWMNMRANSMAELSFISFETFPQQRAFWKEAVKMYNGGRPSAPVVLKELPQNISYTDFPRYIVENGFDIIMLQSRDKVFEELLEPLPRSFLKKLNSDEYIFKDFNAKFNVSVPIKSSPLLILWNKTLAASLGIANIPERLRRGEMLELHMEAAEKMPKGACAGGHLWDYFILKGLKAGIPDLETAFLEERLELFEKFSGRPEMFVCEQEYNLEIVDRFFKGELLFAPGFPLFYCAPNIPFDMGAMFFMPDEGNVVCRGAIYLGVYKNSAGKKAAFDFIDFMISEPAQKLIVTQMWDSPCLKKAVTLFSGLFENTDSENIYEYLRRSPFSGPRNQLFSRQYNFLVYDIRDVLYALMHGRLNSKQAAETILKRWREYGKK